MAICGMCRGCILKGQLERLMGGQAQRFNNGKQAMVPAWGGRSGIRHFLRL